MGEEYVQGFQSLCMKGTRFMAYVRDAVIFTMHMYIKSKLHDTHLSSTQL